VQWYGGSGNKSGKFLLGDLSAGVPVDASLNGDGDYF